MKQCLSHKFSSLCVLSLALSLAISRLHAQQPQIIYVYDDLGRLSRVANQNNECATYEYDAVGNLLSITRTTNCLQPPTINNLSQVEAHAGDTACFAIAGANFLGATVTTDNPEIFINRLQVSDTALNVCFNISNLSSLGSTNIIITTAGGSAQSAFTIDPRIVVIKQTTSIGKTDTSLENTALTIDGAVTVMIDGAHQFNSLTLRNGAVVAHSTATATTTSKTDLTITGLLQIDATSRIDVTGRGFLGGGQPGNLSNNGMTVGFKLGSGSGNGGSYGGLAGGYSGSPNPVYGDFTNPNDAGSGGGGFGSPAGNGGGLVRIVAQAIALDGAIRANGGAAAGNSTGGGSGGGIRIDVGTLSGAGTISANGSAGISNGGGGGGGGRVAVYYQDATGFDLTKVNAFGAAGSGAPNGAAGTVYLQGPARENGELIVDNNNITVATLSTPIPNPAGGTISLTHLRVRRQARVRMDSLLNLSGTLEVATSGEWISSNRASAGTINLTSNSVISQISTTGTASFKVDLTATTMTVDATSRLDATGRGYLGGAQPGNLSNNGMMAGFKLGSGSGNGGSYGGLAGAYSGIPNPVYGDFTNPNDAGSGGGGFGSPAGNGGGLIRIVAQTIALDGAISANGGIATGGGSGGGSGGGIRIDVGTLSGAGTISTNGSVGTSSGGGGGGGGRIAIYYQDATGFNLAKVTAFGAIGSGAPNGAAGTVYLQGPARENGELIVDNNNLAVATLSTPIPNPSGGTISLAHMRVRRQARVRMDSLLNLSGTLEVATSGEWISSNRVTAGTINLTSNSVLGQISTTGTASFKIDLAATTMTVDATSRIDATGLGYLGGGHTGNPFDNQGMTVGFQGGSTMGSGGSYGGLGGFWIGSANPVYGDFTNPNDVGSGGAGFGSPAGNGGGLVRIVAQTIALDGAIRTNGGIATGGGSGGGSGGGVRIDVGTLSGAGTISANGSAGTSNGGSGGGGGRIGIYYQDATAFNLGTKVTASGGAGSGAPNGQNGTIFLHQQTFVGWLLPPMDAPVMKARAELDSPAHSLM